MSLLFSRPIERLAPIGFLAGLLRLLEWGAACGADDQADGGEGAKRVALLRIGAWDEVTPYAE